MIDDARVSRALAASDKDPAGRTADLAAIAEMRLRSHAERTAPAPRRLVAARYLRIADFLSREEHQRVLDIALAHELGRSK
jgi:hypothetical protein